LNCFTLFRTSACVALIAAATAASASAPARQTGTGPRLAGFNGVGSVKVAADGDMDPVYAIGVVDFDKQGGADIATIQRGGVLSVLYNDGHGGFGAAYTNGSAAAFSPWVTYLEAADLNNDGYPDIVAADPSNSELLVFMNKAGGTFTDAVSIHVQPASGARLQGMALGDVNHDGNIDVVTVSQKDGSGSTTLSELTFLGKGDGTFQAPVGNDSTLTGNVLIDVGRSVVLADMNRDGNLDLVAQLYRGGQISLGAATGNGDGTFQSIPGNGAGIPAGPQPASSLTVADVNADGIPDALFISFSDKIYVAMGQPGGSLQAPSAVLSAMSGAVLLTVGDFNKDGKPDLFVDGSGQVGVYAGNGEGTFQAAAIAQYTSGYPTNEQPAPVDLNNDGNLDVVSLDNTNGRAALFLGRGNGTFRAATPVRPANAGDTQWAGNIQVIATGDFNGDGKPDVLVYDWPQASVGGPADLYAGLNDGRGNFNFVLAMPSAVLQQLAGNYGSIVIDAATADFNGDGRSDVVFRTGPGIAILLANADGSLSTTPIDATFPVSVGCNPFFYVTVADVNGDHKPDMVAGYAQNPYCPGSESTPSGYFVMLGDGTGHFTTNFTQFADLIYFVRTGDLNSDGKQDLVVGNLVLGSGFELYALPGNGDGSFNTDAATKVIDHQYISNILIGDFNGDGKQDLAPSTDGTADADGGIVPGTEGVLMMTSNGDFSFGAPNMVLPGMRCIWNGESFADLNRDGKLDLVFETYAQDQKYMQDFGLIAVPNIGDGNFGTPVSALMPLDIVGDLTTFVSDFNGDGYPDVILGAGLSSPLFLNIGASAVASPSAR
jgi:hypothetical protein